MFLLIALKLSNILSKLSYFPLSNFLASLIFYTMYNIKIHHLLISILLISRRFEDSIRSIEFNVADDEILRHRDRDFCRWLINQVEKDVVDIIKIRYLCYGPLKFVKSYGGIMVNGYSFTPRIMDNIKLL